jgi:hypothetical protein
LKNPIEKIEYLKGVVNKKKDNKISHINYDMYTMLTGLVRLGINSSGDSCFLNTLPNTNTVAVYGYDHEEISDIIPIIKKVRDGVTLNDVPEIGLYDNNGANNK